MAEPLCQRWLIAGRVQGVGYRAWMVDRASASGVGGWVRNLPDGRVEAVVSGDSGALALLHRACVSGPADARVDKIEVLELGSGTIPAGAGFSYRRDGR